MIVSPEEADQCLMIIRRLSEPKRLVHVVFHEPALTRRMLHFNNFDYCAFPALPANFEAPMWLKVQLGIFAGRLYFDYEELQHIKDFLGIADDSLDEDKVDIDDSDQYRRRQLSSAPEPSQSSMGAISKKCFTQSPIAFMNDFLLVRRKDSEISGSPMSYVLSGKPISQEHTFFAPAKHDGAKRKLATIHHSSTEEVEEDHEAYHGDDLEFLMAGEEIVIAEEDSDDGVEYYHDARTSQTGDDFEPGDTGSDSDV